MLNFFELRIFFDLIIKKDWHLNNSANKRREKVSNSTMLSRTEYFFEIQSTIEWSLLNGQFIVYKLI